MSPARIIDDATLQIDVRDIPESAVELRVEVTCDAGYQFVRTPAVQGTDLLVRIDDVPEGDGELSVVARAADGDTLVCRQEKFFRVEPGTTVLVRLTPGLGEAGACDDDSDNDCDDFKDCLDDDCHGEARECLVGTCVGVQTCTPSGWGNCSATPTQERNANACNDSADNDCDGQVDCEDSDCQCSNCGC